MAPKVRKVFRPVAVALRADVSAKPSPEPINTRKKVTAVAITAPATTGPQLKRLTSSRTIVAVSSLRTVVVVIQQIPSSPGWVQGITQKRPQSFSNAHNMCNEMRSRELPLGLQLGKFDALRASLAYRYSAADHHHSLASHRARLTFSARCLIARNQISPRDRKSVV